MIHRSLSRKICPNLIGHVTLLPFDASIVSTRENADGGQQEEARWDRARIAISQPYEVSYWSKKFKVTPIKLKAAVAAVGHSSKAVGAHLAKRRAPKKAKKSASKTSRKTTKKRARKKAA